MKNKKIFGFIIIAVVFSFVAIYLIKSYETTTELQQENQKLRNAKDCTIHESVIQDLKNNNDNLQGEVSALKAEGDVTDDISFFVQQYYNNNNNGIAYPYENIKELVTEELYAELAPNFDDTDLENTYYVSKVSEIKSYHTEIDEDEVQALSRFKLYIYNEYNKEEPIVSNMLMTFNLIYNQDKEKWIVTDVLQNSSVRYTDYF